ncbi:hypothetical protein JOM56_010523 [Amanita muscaria]
MNMNNIHPLSMPMTSGIHHDSFNLSSIQEGRNPFSNIALPAVAAQFQDVHGVNISGNLQFIDNDMNHSVDFYDGTRGLEKLEIFVSFAAFTTLPNKTLAIVARLEREKTFRGGQLAFYIPAERPQLIPLPLRAMNITTSQTPQLAPVITTDGVDDCSNEQRRFPATLGNTVNDRRVPLRSLISSRPEALIEETLNQFQGFTLRIDLATLDDLNCNIEKCLIRISDFSCFIGGSQLHRTAHSPRKRRNAHEKELHIKLRRWCSLKVEPFIDVCNSRLVSLWPIPFQQTRPTKQYLELIVDPVVRHVSMAIEQPNW